MNVIAVVVTLLAVVTGLNLFILLGVIRRLREISVPAGAPPDSGVPPVGTVIGEFSESTVDGVPVTEDRLRTGRSLAIFLSPACPPCQQTAEELAAHRDQLPASTYVFLQAEPDEPRLAGMLETLAGVGQVLVHPESSTVQRAFGTSGFPAAIVVRDGRVAFASFAFTEALPLMRDDALTR